MQNQLSVGLLNKIKASIYDAKTPKMYFSNEDELTPKQINKILALPNGLAEVEQEVSEFNAEYMDDIEFEHLRDLLRKVDDLIAEEFDIPEEEITDNFLDKLISEYGLLYETQGVTIDIERLVKNSTPRVVLQLDLCHSFEGWKWEAEVEYDDVKEVLEIFNVNPRKINKRFPNLRSRDGKEYLLPKDLRELWENAPYGGQYVMPVALDLSDYQQHRNHFHTGIVLHKGNEIWLHDYRNGSGSISIPLQKDLTIVKSNLNYFFGDDNDAAGYGLDEVYGLTHSAWSNTIAPSQIEPPTLHTLPPPSELVEHLIYGNVFASWQLSTFIRPYHSYGPKYNQELPEPGEMMEWDMRHGLWDHFPAAGKRYLREQADPYQRHCVFCIREVIGQVAITHCQFIVNDQTREVVWKTIDSSTRSYAVFEQAATVIAATRKNA